MSHSYVIFSLSFQRIHVSLNNEEQKRMLIELNASMKSGQCPYMVRFYGAMFREGDVWICMEVMDTSLDKFYRMCVDQGQSIPEPVLSRLSFCVSRRACMDMGCGSFGIMESWVLGPGS